MKRLIILAFVMGGVFTFNSCTKTELETEQVSQAANNKPVTEMTDNEVEAKINAFIKKAETNEKSNETLSLDDAIWNIEAGLNYSFCINEVDLIADYTETVDFTITDNNGNINFNEVANIFTHLKVKTKELKKTAQYISVIDVDNEEGTISYTVSKEKTDKAVSSLLNIYGDWKWGALLGDCNGNYSGSNDAFRKVRSNITLHKLVFLGGTYWTSPAWKVIRGDSYLNLNDDVLQDNHRDYLIFFRRTGLPNFSTCIQQADINWYQNNIWNLMNSEIQTGYQPICFDDPSSSMFQYLYNGILWQVTYKYGIKHYSNPNNGM